MAEKVPGWVERLLIPTLEAKVRSIVVEELGKFEKTIDARFETVNARIDGVNTRIDSLERQFPTMKEMADIRARLSHIERSSR